MSSRPNSSMIFTALAPWLAAHDPETLTQIPVGSDWGQCVEYVKDAYKLDHLSDWHDVQDLIQMIKVAT